MHGETCMMQGGTGNTDGAVQRLGVATRVLEAETRNMIDLVESFSALPKARCKNGA